MEVKIMLYYFGVYELDCEPYVGCVNVTGNTIEEIKMKYEKYVDNKHGYIINLYPMTHPENKRIYGEISSHSITI